MTISLYAREDPLLNDLGEMLRLFYGNAEILINREGGDTTVRLEETLEGDWRVTVCVCGPERVLLREARGGDAVEDKRLRRRQAKRTLYAVLKRVTGYTPPWGSLTGIRPTRLVWAELAQGYSLPEACARVQRTFDVSPEKMDLLRDIVAVQSALPAPGEKQVDFYVGIPFCVSRCAYCSFLSGEVGKGTQLRPYVDALKREIAFALDLAQRRGLTPRAFYMGGGTPTALPAPLLEEVLGACAPVLARCPEKTVEAGRPDTITAEKLAVLRQAGVERISVNPQTMHDETLQRIGRRHTRQQTEEAYALARKMGFEDINMDLIAGLPGEDEAMFEATLAWVRALAPDSVTVHTLSIKRSSLLHLWEAQLPDGEMVHRMVQSGRQAAGALGMRPYYLYRQKYMAGNQENVGYALPGRECLYNVDMMEEIAPVMALGAGASSKRLYPEQGLIRRAYNVSDIGQYISRVEEMCARKEALWGEEAGGGAAGTQTPPSSAE